MNFNAEEMSRLQNYLTKTLKCQGFALKKREKVGDSVEVLLDGEFVGVIYKDTEDGETSYDFNMAILESDI